MVKWWQYHPIIAPYPRDWIHEENMRKDAKAWMNMATDHIEQLEATLDELLTYQVASEAAARNIGELTKIMQKHRVLLRENMTNKIIAPNPASLLESEDYKRGWYDGYHEAKKELRNNEFPATPSPVLWPNDRAVGCAVCGMYFGSGAWGYVCSLPNCPNRTSC